MRCEDCIHEKVCEGYSNCEEVGLCEPKRKHGEWIKISPAGIYECSNCHNEVMTGDIDVYEWCHRCGADMREGDET